MSSIAPSLTARMRPPKEPRYPTARIPWLGGRHLARRLARLGLQVCTDAVLLVFFSILVEAIRIGPWFPPAVGEVLDQLLPTGTHLITRFPLTVIFCLVLVGSYGAIETRRAMQLRAIVAALTMTLPVWTKLWEFTSPLFFDSYLLLTALLALCLFAAQRLSDGVRRAVTPRRLRANKALLVAAPNDLRRAQRHRGVSDPKMFAIRGMFDPAELVQRSGFESLCQAIRRSDADTVVLCCGALDDRAFNVVVDATNAMGCGLVSLTRSPGGSGVSRA